jgi:predicted Zn-dependent protease
MRFNFTRKSILTLFIAPLFAACATSPMGRTQLAFMPSDQVAAMGAQAFQQKRRASPVETDEGINRYVQCVARSLLGSDVRGWEVAVFRDASPNAFALPGGKIGVQTGILKAARNQHQLAAVLAHEIAHVRANHANERISQQFATQKGLDLVGAVSNPTTATGQTLLGLLGLGAKYGVLLPYNRVQESEADLVGLEGMAQAGFDPEQAVQLWLNMERLGGGQPVEFLSTHPSHATRIQDLQNRMPRALALRQQAQASGRNPQCDAR